MIHHRTEQTPLLLPPHSETETPDNHRTSTLDDIIERSMGSGFGHKQFLQVILLSFAWVFDSQQTFITVFTDAHPTWHCINTTTCTSSANLCHLPRDSWSWDLPAHASIVSEWSLECTTSFLTVLPASSFFMGCFAGGLLLPMLADSFLGRKRLLSFSCLLMSLSGVLTALSTNLWMYATLRFLSGFGRATIGTCALVLSSELVGKRWRGQVGVVGFFCFTFGFLSLPLVAYLNRGGSWRLVYLWTCGPAIIYSVVVQFFVHESPRWLFVRGRKAEFVETMRSIARVENDESSLTLSFFDLSTELLCDLKETQQEDNNFWSTLRTLWEKGWAFQRLAAVMAVGLGIGLVYYGMPLGVESLAFNLYWSVTLNALAELPASVFIFFVIGKSNRKGLLLGFAFVSGICCISCAMIGKNGHWKEVQIGLELGSFFSACAACDVLLIYTVELFPTCVRNSALSMVRQALVFGGAFGPLLIAAGRNNSLYSYGVFGAAIATCCLFVGRLPETKGITLSDTLDDD